MVSDLRPAVTLGNYVSYMVSPYNRWFCALGYPLLDINQYLDGEWEIIQYHRSPVIPALTPWSRVLMKIRHTEITYAFCSKWTEQLDLEKRYVWDQVEKREELQRQDLLRQELHIDDITNRQLQAIKQNPDLMNRIAKNGLQELMLWQISKHVPNHHFRKGATYSHERNNLGKPKRNVIRNST